MGTKAKQHTNRSMKVSREGGGKMAKEIVNKLARDDSVPSEWRVYCTVIKGIDWIVGIIGV